MSLRDLHRPENRFPRNEEFAVGAVSETGTVVVNEDIVTGYRVSRSYLEKETKRQQEVIRRRADLYRGE